MTTGDVVQVVNTEGEYANFDDGSGDWNILGPIRQLTGGTSLSPIL